ncbi:MAG TPA: Spy/CpxP family protein refolding chaperone [Pyrinomonadaceae bacterium]
MRINRQTLVPILLLAVALAASSNSFANILTPQDPPAQTQTTSPDLIQELQLTPEQRQKIRAMREEMKNERATINQRVRETNFALEQALDADKPDETLIEQRLRDAATAQAASMRMRIQTELRIRRILTLEQLAIWRALRQQSGRPLRDLRIESQRPNRRGRVLNPDGRNGIAPVLRPRNTLPRTRRP